MVQATTARYIVVLILSTQLTHFMSVLDENHMRLQIGRTSCLQCFMPNEDKTPVDHIKRSYKKDTSDHAL